MVTTRRAAALSALATEAIGAASRLTPAPRRTKRRRPPDKKGSESAGAASRAASAAGNGSKHTPPKKRPQLRAKRQVKAKAAEQGTTSELSHQPKDSEGAEDSVAAATSNAVGAASVEGVSAEQSPQDLQTVQRSPSPLHTPPSASPTGVAEGVAAPQSSSVPREPAAQPPPPSSNSANAGSGGQAVPADGLRVDGVLFDSLVESVAPLLCDLTQEQMQHFVLHSCAKQLRGGGDIDPDKIANAVFSIDRESAEWQTRMQAPHGITVVRAASATQQGQDLRVLRVTLGRPPALLQCCATRQVTHTFTFDAGSSKVLSEVDRCIRSVVDASMQYMSTDKQVPYLLLSAAGDVVVLNKELLQACPSASRAVRAAPVEVPVSTATPVPLKHSAGIPQLFLVRKGMGSVAWDIGAEALHTWRLLALGVHAAALWALGGMRAGVFVDTVRAVTIGVPQDAVQGFVSLASGWYSLVRGLLGEASEGSDAPNVPHAQLLEELLYIVAVVCAVVCLFRALRVYAAAYLMRWASVQYAFVGASAARALCSSSARPALPGSNRRSLCCTHKPSALAVGWDEGRVWRRGHFVWSEKGASPASAPVRLFSLAWLAGERAPNPQNTDENEAQEAVTKAALAATDDSAYTAWLATLRAAAGWQADHLSLDVVLSTMGSKLQHQVISRDFVAKWPHWQRVVRAGSAAQPSVLTEWAPSHTAQCVQQDALAQGRVAVCIKPSACFSTLCSAAVDCGAAVLRGDIPALLWIALGQPAAALLSAAGAAPALETAHTFHTASWALHRTGQLHQLQSWPAHVARLHAGWVARTQAALGRAVLWAALLQPLWQALLHPSSSLTLVQSSHTVAHFVFLRAEVGTVRACVAALLACSLLVNLADTVLEYWARLRAALCARRTPAGAGSSRPRMSAPAAAAWWLWSVLSRTLLALGRTAAVLLLPLLAAFALETVQLGWGSLLLLGVSSGAGGVVMLALARGLMGASDLQRMCVGAVVGPTSCALSVLAVNATAPLPVVLCFAAMGGVMCLAAVDSGLSAAGGGGTDATLMWCAKGPVAKRFIALLRWAGTALFAASGPVQPVVLDAAAVCGAAAALSAFLAQPGETSVLETSNWVQYMSKLSYNLLKGLQERVAG